MMEQEYTVELTMEALAPLQEDTLFALAEIGGAVGAGINSTKFTMTLTARGQTPSAAIDDALHRVLPKVGEALVLGASAMTTEAFDATQEERWRLAGVAEVAMMLGISRQRVSALSKRHDFPAPIQRLAAGPLWRAGDLSTFREGWQRKGGRPRAATAGATAG